MPWTKLKALGNEVRAGMVVAVVNGTSSLSLDEVAAAVIVSEVYVLVSMNRMKANALDEVLLVAPRTRNGHRFWDNNYP